MEKLQMKILRLKNFIVYYKKQFIIIAFVMLLLLLFLLIYFLLIKCDYKETKNSSNIVTNYAENKLPNNKILRNYEEYKKFWNDYSGYDFSTSKLKENNFQNNDYIVYFYKSNKCVSLKNYLLEAKYKKKQIILKTVEYTGGGSCGNNTYAYLIETPKNYYQKLPEIKINKETLSDDDIIEKTKIVAEKPILYLYPKEKTDVLVKLKNDQKIITSYPKYENGWKVTALPNGDLSDENNKYYYALYWDETLNDKKIIKNGFYVEKENSLKFLEEKLEYLGLNDKERNEFIMYWLPVLENNGKNLIYFELTEERQKNNELIIYPKPDSLLRINMIVKKVTKKVDIPEQKLEKFDRKGFVAVEWAGTNY